MKGGHKPVLIQRFAPSDYHADEHVQLLESRHDYLTLNFYRSFMDYAFINGGELPSDPETLGAIVKMPKKDVKKALKFCLGRLVFQDGDRLYQKRVRREIKAELKFRENQAIEGAKGGRRKIVVEIEGEPKATLLDSESPPDRSPAPTPDATPAPVPSPESSSDRHSGSDRRVGSGPNPLVEGRRPEMEREALRLVGEIAALTDEDPTVVMGRASHWKGRRQMNPADMSDNRLANTLIDLKTEAARLKGEPGPRLERAPSNHSPPPSDTAVRRRVNSNAMFQGGLRDERRLGEGADASEGEHEGPGDDTRGGGGPRPILPRGTGSPER